MDNTDRKDNAGCAAVVTASFSAMQMQAHASYQGS